MSEEVGPRAPAERRTAAGRRHPCPQCGSRDVARIVYGEPAWNADWEAKLESGEWSIGGCVLMDGQADFTCNACETSFRRDGTSVPPTANDGR